MRFVVPLAGLLLLAGSTVSRADTVEFVVPPGDGYGIAECMKPGEECGQVIADAWCESHGHAHATGFGLAADVTAAIKAVSTAATPVPPPGSILIHCGE